MIDRKCCEKFKDVLDWGAPFCGYIFGALDSVDSARLSGWCQSWMAGSVPLPLHPTTFTSARGLPSAHYIKSSKTKTFQTIAALRSECRWAVTGVAANVVISPPAGALSQIRLSDIRLIVYIAPGKRPALVPPQAEHGSYGHSFAPRNSEAVPTPSQCLWFPP